MAILSRPRPTPKHLPLILALACGSWGVVSAGVYLFGVGALTLLEMIGGAL
jgi:hypothetical protein